MASEEVTEVTSKDIVLPSRLKCDRCSKIKPQIQFNDKELDQLKKIFFEHQSNNMPTPAALATCNACLAVRAPPELECQGCDRWLASDRFSKQMRKNPDTAYCWDCSVDRQNMKPATRFDEESDNEFTFRTPGDDWSDDDSDDDEVGGGTTVAGATSTMGTMSLSSTRDGGVAVSASTGPVASGSGTRAATASAGMSRPSTSRGPASSTKSGTCASNTWPTLGASGKQPAPKSTSAQPAAAPAARSQVKAPKPVLGGPRYPLDEVAVEDSDHDEDK